MTVIDIVRHSAVIVTAACFLVTGFGYGRAAYRGTIQPVPATWVMMFITMLLSLSMYRSNPHKSWSSNIGVTAGFINSIMILSGVMGGELRRRGKFPVTFTSGQVKCMIAYGLIVTLWFLTGKPLLAYSLVQATALIAYLPTVAFLWRQRGSSEPLWIWCISLAAALSAAVVAVITGDVFARVYVGRSVPTTTMLVVLIVRAKRRA